LTPLALAHPALLWTGLGLIAVPILIHYFFRRRHRVVRWAAMEFLLAALKKQRRRVEIENLILLALRCLAILLLGLAVARPTMEGGVGLGAFATSARAMVLVVDTSTSMGAQHTGQTVLERARERAADLLDDLPGESRITLVVTRDENSGGRPRALLENATPTEARNGLNAIQLGFGPNRLGDAFRLAAGKAAAMTGRRCVVLVTDLQRRDWNAIDDLRKALDEIAPPGTDASERTPVTVLDVGSDAVSNVTVGDLRIEVGEQAFAGEWLTLVASVVHHGSPDEPGAGTLTLYTGRGLDGQWEMVASSPDRHPCCSRSR
jgi:hypothetical protein